MEDTLGTSSEEDAVVVASLGVFTVDAASKPWLSFILRAFSVQEVVFVNGYV